MIMIRCNVTYPIESMEVLKICPYSPTGMHVPFISLVRNKYMHPDDAMDTKHELMSEGSVSISESQLQVRPPCPPCRMLKGLSAI